MAFDYKKEYKEFYMPKETPTIVTVPKINYIAVRGKGDPNEENGEYKNSIALLYAIAFTIKMSYKGSRKIEGYFDYVVLPLEGFWRQEGGGEIDYANKNGFYFISLIRLPEYRQLRRRACNDRLDARIRAGERLYSGYQRRALSPRNLFERFAQMCRGQIENGRKTSDT